MEDRNLFKQALKIIKMLMKKKGQDFSEKDIAKRLNISMEQLQLYKDGKETLSEDEVRKFKSSYGFETILVQDVVTISFPFPPKTYKDELEDNE